VQYPFKIFHLKTFILLIKSFFLLYSGVSPLVRWPQVGPLMIDECGVLGRVINWWYDKLVEENRIAPR
jgi:hypothetical protein